MKTQEASKVSPVTTNTEPQIKSRVPSSAPAPAVTDDIVKAADVKTDVKPTL